MRQIKGRTVVLYCFSLAPLLGQTPIVMSAGYGPPAMIQVTPGQIVTLYISGTKTILPSQSPSIKAATVPLPTKLAGFTVTVRQGNNSYTAPLISVTQTSSCTDDNSSTQCIITALTVQIPFEIPILDYPLPLTGDLTVNDNGSESAHFPIALTLDEIHILTVCDQLGTSPLTPSPCNGIVAHSDGTIVTGGSPATPGETVVIYAYGLGPTRPAVTTGTVTPTPAPTLLGAANVTVQFDFRPNAGPAMPHLSLTGVISPTPITGSVASPTPLFVGLTPGQVGLYQVNVKLPDTIPPVPACTGVYSCLGSLLKCLVQSNLTIDIGGWSSFDGAAICVQPQ